MIRITFSLLIIRTSVQVTFYKSDFLTHFLIFHIFTDVLCNLVYTLISESSSLPSLTLSSYYTSMPYQYTVFPTFCSWKSKFFKMFEIRPIYVLFGVLPCCIILTIFGLCFSLRIFTNLFSLSTEVSSFILEIY